MRPWLLALAVATSTAPGVHGQAPTSTHGEVVGSVDHRSAIVWVRASRTALVNVRYATNPGLAGALETPRVTAGSGQDFVHKALLFGLAADTPYWFAVRMADPSTPTQSSLGPVGSFRTAPAPGAAALTRIVLTGDIRDGQSTAIFGSMLAHAPRFFVMLGDFPYADGARSVAEYWQKHKDVRDDGTLQAFLRQVPMFGTWDDHEVANNWDANTDPVLVSNGTAAWRLYFPIPAGTTEIWRTRRWGDALELFVLDTRLHRGVNGDPDLPGKPLLGATQLAWLKNALRASTATWKIVATSVPLRFGTTGTDSWDGTMRERADLLSFLQREHIENVVFVSADQHWAASHHHREGFREFQVGPAATGTRPPRAHAEPERRWVREASNYGSLTVDPGQGTLTMEWRDVAGSLWRTETIAAGSPATMRVTTDLPEARFALTGGPFLVANSGSQATYPRVEAGSFTARFTADPLGDGVPADLDLTLPPGSVAHVAADYRDVASTAHPVLLADDFDGSMTGFTIVDEGTTSGPSAWFTDAGYLVQNSNIFTSTSSFDRLGTMAVRGDPAWTDYTLRARLLSYDNDIMGVVFRYRGSNDYYRFSLDRERGTRQLVSRRNGVFRLLASDTAGYEAYRTYAIDVVALGDRIRVRQDGAVVFDVTDRDHPTGSIGLYCWGNQATLFDDLIVRAGDATAAGASALFEDHFEDGVFAGWTVIDQGAVNAPSNWFESGGLLHQTSNINDGILSAQAVPKLGTLAVAGPKISDHELSVRVRNDDNDALGVVFRFGDPANHYRFSMDAERTYRRLAVVRNGLWTTLWEDATIGYTVGAWHTVGVRCEGDQLSVALDGVPLATVTDTAHPSGITGLYCWGSDAAAFDDFVLTSPVPQRAVLAAVLAGGTTALTARAPASAGLPYLLALSGARAPGIPLALLDPTDPRVLELAPDGLFFASLQPLPISSGFAGTLDRSGGLAAQLTWPPLPGLSGLTIHAGGLVFDRMGGIGELLPTVDLRIP